MERYEIGVNTQAETDYKNKLNHKQRLGREAIAYCGQFVELNDLSDFLEDMEATFVKLFNVQTKDSLNPAILLEKRLELVGFELHKLQAIESAFKGINIKLDAGLNPIERKDFGIYLTDPKQIELYQAKERLLDAITEYQKETNLEVKPALFQRSAPGQFNYDYSQGKLQPNY